MGGTLAIVRDKENIMDAKEIMNTSWKNDSDLFVKPMACEKNIDGDWFFWIIKDRCTPPRIVSLSWFENREHL